MRFLLAALALTGCGRGLVVHVEPDAGQMVSGCDVLVQNCPIPVEACFPVPGGAAACAAAGTRGEGSPCVRPTDCNGGFTCSGGAASVCTRLCGASAVNACGEGQACTGGLCTPPGRYGACVVSAGLDHLTLIHSEPARNLCTLIALASPGTNAYPSLSLPLDWAVQGASVARITGGCPPGFTGAAGALADDLSGRIAFTVSDGGFLPDRLEAFVNVFGPADAGTPAQLTVQVSDLEVVGCF